MLNVLITKSKLLFSVLLALVLSSQVVAWSHDGEYPVAVLSDQVNNYNLIPYLSYLKQENNLTFEQAQAQLQAGKFHPLKQDYPNLGFSQGDHWFHFSLKNAVEMERTLLVEVDYAILDTLEFYCYGNGSAPRYFLAGDHLQYESRQISVRNYLIPLSVSAREVVNCLVKLRSNSNVALPIRVYDEISYIESSHQSERWLGVLYGIAVALMIYNLIQYVLMRDTLFLFFLLHVLGGILYTSFSDGSLSAFWIALNLQDSGALIAIGMCSSGAILFSSRFLALKVASPRLNLLCKALVVGAVLMSAYSIFDPNGFMHWLVTVYSLLISGFLLVCGVKRYFDRFNQAGIYLLGFGAVFLMAGWMVLNVLFFHSDVRWVTYGLSLVWVAELVVLSVVLSSRVRSVEEEHSNLEERMQVMKSENQTKTDFMAKVSHEIRTPMNGMLGLIELLLSTPLNKDQRRYISAIQNAGKGLLHVINDVLDFSRIEAGKMSISEDPFDLKELLSDACAIYEYDARKKCVELGCFIAPGTPLQLIGDATRIRQVILNTLSNALKYTEKGFVHINVQLTDHIHNDKLVLRFEIEDSGVGISAQDQSKLFQSYSQVNSNVHKPGTGLGLVISQQFVNLMGGEMGVQSELGAGSCFWFNLPLGVPDDVRIAEGAVMLDLFNGEPDDEKEPEIQIDASFTPFREKALQKGIVLVVEDNAINQNVIYEFLQKMDLSCELADNGRSAVELIRSGQHYDLILMDCEMPVMDGYEAANKILKWQKSKEIINTPIIALSAHAMDRHRQMAFDAGMVDYITKPITYEQLHNKLARYLDLPEPA